MASDNSHPRYAIYFAPSAAAPLGEFGTGIVGYDCFSAKPVPHRRFGEFPPALLAAATLQPALYGFHATIVAPFEPVDSAEPAIIDELERFAQRWAAAPIGRMEVTALGGYVALVPRTQPPALGRLANACVERFDPFRAPLTAAERERRLQASLTPRQAELLDRWGYPYVFDQFRFHLTLAGPMEPPQHRVVLSLLRRAFLPLAETEFTVDALSLVQQPDRQSRFRVVACRPLTGTQ